MEDNFTPDCDNIKSNLKPFMEDMLKEEEYQSFLGHIATCSKCKEYVGSVDSFSNQLWKLGDVKVPSDFCSTVLFKLKQPEEKIQDSELDAPKKFPVGILVSGFAVIALILGIGVFYILRKAPEMKVEIAQVPLSVVPREVAQEPVREWEAEPRHDYPKEDTAKFESGGVVTGGPFQQENNVMAYFESDGADSDGNATALKPPLLHWHFLRYNRSRELEALRLRREERNLAAKLRQNYREMKQLEAGQPSEDLALKIEKQKSVIKDAEDKHIELKAKLEQSLLDKSRRAGEPLNILGKLSISLDYQDDDFLLFAANGKILMNVLEQIALISEGSSPLRDFTPLTSSPPNQEYQISIYIEQEKTSVQHWHVKLAMLNQKNQLLKMIREKGGMITYEYEEEVTFSITNFGIERLKEQMPAMRISLSTFGNQAGRGSQSADEMVVVSVYFSK